MPRQGSPYREYPPCGALKPYVQCYWSRVSAGAGPPTELHRVLPDGCMDIVFNFGDSWERRDSAAMPVQRERSAVVGTMSRPLLVEPGRWIEFLGVRFQPGKSPAFLKLPAAELTDGSTALDNVWGRAGKELETRLGERHSIRERIDTLERELVRRLAAERGPDAGPDAVLAAIFRRRGRVSVEALSAASGVSRQHLARTFERYVGIGPKLFCRVVRFQALLQRLQRQPPVRWATLALELGYYDQAHMISEFREFAGLSPTRYLAAYH